MPKRESIGTEYQGRYCYPASVEQSGDHWEWEVDRMPNVLGQIVNITPVAEDRAPTRDAAIAAAQAARRDIMDKNRNLD
jgi:hypothetical protein